uniref:Cytochrome P450 n=1 Tax=Oryza nivara TaxID=4536 RepID=A0A0E0G9S2_ORYNI
MSGATADWAWWLGLVAGAVPLLALAVWHCTDAFHSAAFAFRRRGTRARLPPGHMGLPFVGETLALIWPRGGATATATAMTTAASNGRTCSARPRCSSARRRPTGSFGVGWPVPELVGASSLVNVHGGRHARLRRFVLGAINRPGSLRTIARVAQPRVAAALRSWAAKGTITAATEMKNVTFENICKIFVSMEPSPLTEKIHGWFTGRYHWTCQEQRSTTLEREELERRKVKMVTGEGGDDDGDLMSGLMHVEDEQGRRLDDDEVVDNIVSLVIAGYESTASAIMWATYHLAKSPSALAKLRSQMALTHEQIDPISGTLLSDEHSYI